MIKKFNTIDSEKKKNINKIIEKKEYKKVNSDLNESSKIIKENINIMEKDIKAFKEQNIYIKQQLEKMLNKYIKQISLFKLFQLIVS